MAGGTACGKRRRRGTDRRVRPPGNSPDEPSGFLNKGSSRSGSRSLRGSFCFACLPHTGVATSVAIPKPEQDFIMKKLAQIFLPKKEQKFSKPLDKPCGNVYNRSIKDRKAGSRYGGKAADKETPGTHGGIRGGSGGKARGTPDGDEADRARLRRGRHHEAG